MPLTVGTDRKSTKSPSPSRRTQRSGVFSLLDDVHAQAGLEGPWHPQPPVVLLVAAVSLALLNFLSTAPVLAWLLARDETSLPMESTSAFWVGCRLLCYALIPCATLAALGHNPLDFGLRVRGVSRHVRLYFMLALVMLPIVVSVSFIPAFQRYYPFHDYAGQSVRGLLLWEGLYAVQFITLEYFYRGFLLFSLERYLGAYAIFVMVIPYCMVHFGKPFAETLAAIPAGVVLGALALRTRSIWPGAALHIAVGWSMDLLSLWHRGALSNLWSKG
ncbi:MAG: type II CAAX endopeptidase family protein [Pirellulales bacterium]